MLIPTGRSHGRGGGLGPGLGLRLRLRLRLGFLSWGIVFLVLACTMIPRALCDVTDSSTGAAIATTDGSGLASSSSANFSSNPNSNSGNGTGTGTGSGTSSDPLVVTSSSPGSWSSSGSISSNSPTVDVDPSTGSLSSSSSGPSQSQSQSGSSSGSSSSISSGSGSGSGSIANSSTATFLQSSSSPSFSAISSSSSSLGLSSSSSSSPTNTTVPCSPLWTTTQDIVTTWVISSCHLNITADPSSGPAKFFTMSQSAPPSPSPFQSLSSLLASIQVSPTHTLSLSPNTYVDLILIANMSLTLRLVRQGDFMLGILTVANFPTVSFLKRPVPLLSSSPTYVMSITYDLLSGNPRLNFTVNDVAHAVFNIQLNVHQGVTARIEFGSLGPSALPSGISFSNFQFQQDSAASFFIHSDAFMWDTIRGQGCASTNNCGGPTPTPTSPSTPTPIVPTQPNQGWPPILTFATTSYLIPISSTISSSITFQVMNNNTGSDAIQGVSIRAQSGDPSIVTNDKLSPHVVLDPTSGVIATWALPVTIDPSQNRSLTGVVFSITIIARYEHWSSNVTIYLTLIPPPSTTPVVIQAITQAAAAEVAGSLFSVFPTVMGILSSFVCAPEWIQLGIIKTWQDVPNGGAGPGAAGAAEAAALAPAPAPAAALDIPVAEVVPAAAAVPAVAPAPVAAPAPLPAPPSPPVVPTPPLTPSPLSPLQVPSVDPLPPPVVPFPPAGAPPAYLSAPAPGSVSIPIAATPSPVPMSPDPHGFIYDSMEAIAPTQLSKNILHSFLLWDAMEYGHFICLTGMLSASYMPDAYVRFASRYGWLQGAIYGPWLEDSINGFRTSQGITLDSAEDLLQRSDTSYLGIERFTLILGFRPQNLFLIFVVVSLILLACFIGIWMICRYSIICYAIYKYHHQDPFGGRQHIRIYSNLQLLDARFSGILVRLLICAYYPWVMTSCYHITLDDHWFFSLIALAYFLLSLIFNISLLFKLFRRTRTTVTSSQLDTLYRYGACYVQFQRPYRLFICVQLLFKFLNAASISFIRYSPETQMIFILLTHLGYFALIHIYKPHITSLQTWQYIQAAGKCIMLAFIWIFFQWDVNVEKFRLPLTGILIVIHISTYIWYLSRHLTSLYQHLSLVYQRYQARASIDAMKAEIAMLHRLVAEQRAQLRRRRENDEEINEAGDEAVGQRGSGITMDPTPATRHPSSSPAPIELTLVPSITVAPQRMDITIEPATESYLETPTTATSGTSGTTSTSTTTNTPPRHRIKLSHSLITPPTSPHDTNDEKEATRLNHSRHDSASMAPIPPIGYV